MDAPRSLAAVVAAALLALAACGDDGPAAGTPTAPTTAADTAETTAMSESTDTTVAGTAATSTVAPATTVDLAADLDGRTFLSTSVEGYQLVDGSQVELTFDGGTSGRRPAATGSPPAGRWRATCSSCRRWR